MSRVRTRSARARLAVAACLLWLIGVEALPALHEALHDQLAPHRHDGGSIVVASFEDSTHRHPDGTIHFVAPHAHADHSRRRPDDGRAHATGPAGHAAGLAHHAAALAPTAPPVTWPLPIDRRAILVAVARSVELVAIDPLAATARGPPSLG
ncbi:MAG TPA: hypothetical protein VH165_06145 [Kofleriaceae bacterium]|jgi:hypothetical protein|nr:hypothetical protein [Kofleriaceae bacterium]